MRQGFPVSVDRLAPAARLADGFHVFVDADVHHVNGGSDMGGSVIALWNESFSDRLLWARCTYSMPIWTSCCSFLIGVQDGVVVLRVDGEHCAGSSGLLHKSHLLPRSGFLWAEHLTLQVK